MCLLYTNHPSGYFLYDFFHLSQLMVNLDPWIADFLVLPFSNVLIRKQVHYWFKMYPLSTTCFPPWFKEKVWWTEHDLYHLSLFEFQLIDLSQSLSSETDLHHGGEELVDHAAEEDGEDGEADTVDNSCQGADDQQYHISLGGEAVLQQFEVLYEQSPRHGEAGTSPTSPQRQCKLFRTMHKKLF